MAIAPSNNLLNALSQLQGSSRPTASAARPASVGPTFAAQVSAASQSAGLGEAGAVRSASAQQAPTQAPAADPAQSRPRGRYLGQYVNILV